jgi:hypothetical protein
VVAQALTDAAGVANITELAAPGGDEMFRISVTAEGPGAGRFSLTVVASAEFQGVAPHVNILLRERGSGMTASVMD